jgi:anti-sigma B factor antagonist
MSEGARLTILPTDSGWDVEGEIDAHSAPALSTAVAKLPEAPVVIMDLHGVGFMDSSGLRVLLETSRRAAEAGKKLVLRRPQDAVRRVIEVSGLNGHFDVRD